MSRFVPFLPEDEIERDAVALIAEFERSRGVTVGPPVPIEDIVEKHLKLRIEFDDMHKLLGVPRITDDSFGGPDVLGAIWFNDRRIVIDESLDPDQRPSIEGRYRFTLAHEGGGHWRLHRLLFENNPSQSWLFDEAPPPAVICRSSQAAERVEWQANFHASCLLMPRALVQAVWRERYGNENPRVVRHRHRVDLRADADDAMVAYMRTAQRKLDDGGIENHVRPLAERFKVSPAAMRIRLEQLGLLHRELPLQRSFVLGR